MAFPQFEVLNTVTEMDIARTITSEANGIHLTVTDTCTSGTGRGIYVAYTASGTRTSGTAKGIDSSLTITGNTDYVYPLSVSIGQSGDPTIGLVAGLSIYMDDLGDGVDNQIGLDIGFNSADAATDRHCFIRCREHTAIQTSSAVMRLEGANSAGYFLVFDNPAGTEDSEVILDASNCDQYASGDHRIRVHLEHTDVDRYIYLFPI